jgi:hypothetical protein
LLPSPHTFPIYNCSITKKKVSEIQSYNPTIQSNPIRTQSSKVKLKNLLCDLPRVFHLTVDPIIQINSSQKGKGKNQKKKQLKITCAKQKGKIQKNQRKEKETA